MRHDPKYSQSHLSAVRQKNLDDRHYSSTTFYHHKHGYQRPYDIDQGDVRRGSYHHGGGTSGGNGGGNVAHDGNGGTVSALASSSHEAEKQWEWLEMVLEKSKNNRETVSIVSDVAACYPTSFIYYFVLMCLLVHFQFNSRGFLI